MLLTAESNMEEKLAKAKKEEGEKLTSLGTGLLQLQQETQLTKENLLATLILTCSTPVPTNP